MSSTVTHFPMTAAEYLDGERSTGQRHEFVDGRVYWFADGELRHNDISRDVYISLKSHLEGTPCHTFIDAIKVEFIDELTNFYYYPDVFVTREATGDNSYLPHQPKLIIEVISPSTSRTDRGEKLTNYKRIPSVEEIVYIEQDWPEIYIVRRSDRWKKHIYTQFDSLIHLESIDLTLPVSAFYRSAPFPEDVRRPWYLINREDG
jgi:Uma2 family endonuclease